MLSAASSTPAHTTLGSACPNRWSNGPPCHRDCSSGDSCMPRNDANASAEAVADVVAECVSCSMCVNGAGNLSKYLRTILSQQGRQRRQQGVQAMNRWQCGWACRRRGGVAMQQRV
eukprot:359544-Chlamydomonas_euryale.AAC.1